MSQDGGAGGGDNKDNKGKNKQPTGGVPVWSTFMPMGGPVIGLPARPLPQPGMIAAPAFGNLGGGIVPAPPVPGVSCARCGEDYADDLDSTYASGVTCLGL